MTKSELAAKMQEAGAWLPGKTVKLDFGGDGTIMLDGKAEHGQRGRRRRRHHDQGQLGRLAGDGGGQLDGMTAFMTGKLKVEGDMSNAMQLQGVLSKLR